MNGDVVHQASAIVKSTFGSDQQLTATGQPAYSRSLNDPTLTVSPNPVVHRMSYKRLAEWTQTSISSIDGGDDVHDAIDAAHRS